jgi:replicative DNA helicase
MTEPARPLRAVPAVHEAADELWQPPEPLGGRHSLPAFPVDVLPGWVGSYVDAVALETQTPPDLAGSIALAALSTAAGGRALVEVRGSWREPVNLFLLVAMAPGSRKSPVFSAMARPLLTVEKALAEQTKAAIAQANLERRLAQERADKAARNAASAALDATPDAIEAATAAAIEAESITIPVQPQLVADDETPEHLASIMAKQGGRIAVLSAEGGVVGMLAGRYNDRTNLDVFLKGHAGDMLRVGRQGREAEHIDRPALTLGLAVQPAVLRELADIPGGRDKGLLARILYSWPEDLVGHREIDPPTAAPELAEIYTTNLEALTRSLAEWTDPAVLTLTPDANQLRYALQAATEPRLAAGGEWSHLRDWFSKWVGATARLAGLLHLAEHLRDGWHRDVTADTWQRAETLARYYADHAVAVFAHIGTDETTQDARHLLAWIQKSRPDRFTVRDAHRANRGRFNKPGDLQPALDLLEEHNHIRRAPDLPRDGPGRKPSPAYYVHPLHRQGGSR